VVPEAMAAVVERLAQTCHLRKHGGAARGAGLAFEPESIADTSAGAPNSRRGATISSRRCRRWALPCP